MRKSNPLTLFVISSILLGACLGRLPTAGAPSAPGLDNSGQPGPAQDATQPFATEGIAAAQDDHNDSEHHSDVDLTHLEVGDEKYSTSAQVGYVYSCMTQFNGGGASGTGDWINGDGTWDAAKKAVVDGSVTWPHSFTVSIQGDQRIFTGNDLPDHSTGTFPISSSDDAYAVDRNPNSIKEQSITLSLPVTPTASAQPNCVGGEIGIMLSGVVIFSAFDAEGRDAVAHEVQDACDGHPQASGLYHYHNLSDCIEDAATSGHSSLLGYAFDGYGVYGYYGEDGSEITNDDLDACHGHTHVVAWDGQMVDMYHYHATHEFPYVVSCFHGETAVPALSAGEGQRGQQNGQQAQPPTNGQQLGQGQPSTNGQQGGQANSGQQPPQEAITACVGLSVNSACSINTPNGTLSGTCQSLQSSITACVPAGGPPSP